MLLNYKSSILCAGLDPAGPSFENAAASARLASSDAVLVDTISTDAGALGIRQCVGQVCFYPNRGTWPQPGCSIFDLLGESVCINVHLPLYRSPEYAQKLNAELLTITHWLGQIVGGILPRIPGLDPRTFYCRYFSKVALA